MPQPCPPAAEYQRIKALPAHLRPSAEPMQLPNDYTTSPEAHAAYLRKIGESFHAYTERKFVEMPLEAARMREMAGDRQDKEARYLREEATKKVERAPLVRADGQRWLDTFVTLSERVLVEAGKTTSSV